MNRFHFAPGRRFAVAAAALAVVVTLAPQRGLAAEVAGTAPSGAAFALAVPAVAVPPAMDGTLSDPAWHRATPVELSWDFAFGRPATEATTAYVLADAEALDVAFVARQSSALAASQRTHGVGEGTDDQVTVHLWPGGAHGFAYAFSATPRGTRYQSSSENASFAPTWVAAATVGGGGYTVTMRIPLRVLRVNGSGAWLLQLERTVKATGSVFEWAHVPGQDAVDDPAYAGVSTLSLAAEHARPRPRLQVYGLSQSGAGGTSSRAGADFSLPVSASSTVLGTIRPDYSNVELDQQTIAPSEFARQYLEVRPFFAQGTSLYNRQTCTACSAQQLDTPSIPTPRAGFAIEGKERNLTYGAFDAIGDLRSDDAQMLAWTNASSTFVARVQRVAARLPGVADTSVTTNLAVQSPSTHLFAAASYGFDRATGADGARAGAYADLSAGYATAKSFLGVALRRIGRDYAPLDGYTPSRDVAGYLVSGSREFDFAPGRAVTSVTVQGSLDRYHASAGGWSQTDSNLALHVQLANRLSVGLTTGSNDLLTASGLTAFDQNGIALGFGDGSATPTDVAFSTGRFGAGRLDAWTRATTLRLGTRTLLSLEADDTRFAADGGGRYVQWLERVALTEQLGPGTSFSAGLRRITGFAPPGGGRLTAAPAAAAASNLSFALHHRAGGAELYFAYGDPNEYTTKPVLTIKVIRYFGAEKGT